jgi:hypothetical protein
MSIDHICLIIYSFDLVRIKLELISEILVEVISQ